MTNEELQAILAEAKAAQRAAQKTGEAPLPDEEVRQVIRDAQPRPQSAMDAIGQTLRVSTSSVMDPVRAGVGALTGEDSFRDNLALERAKTMKAREAIENVSPGAASVSKIAGDTAMLAGAMPQSVVSTIPRALGTGAAFGVGNEALTSFEETGQLPTMEEALGAGLAGATGTGIGMILGAGANYAIQKALGKGTQIPKELMKQISKSERTVAESTKKMQASGVVIHQDAVKRMLGRVERALAKDGVSATSQPATWKAINVLRSRVAQGGDVPLTELNAIRRRIRDFEIRGEPYGGVKTATDEMNRFINGLAFAKSKNTVVSGDAKAGVSAWNAMNRNHIQAEKTNTLIQMVRSAEHQAAGKGWEIERALQEEARKMVDNPSLRNKYMKAFNPEEQSIIENIAKGSGVGNWLNKMDAKLGHGIVRLSANTATLPLRAVSNAAARNRMQLAVDGILHGSPVRQSLVSPFAGMATVGELMNQQNAGAMPTPAAAAPPSHIPQPTMAPPPQMAPQQAAPAPAPSAPPKPMQSPQQNPQPLPPSLGQQTR